MPARRYGAPHPSSTRAMRRRMRWWWIGAFCCIAACGGSPVAAVRALDEAARDGDLDEVVKLLGPSTRARLAADARRAGQLAGRRDLPAHELLAAGWTLPRFRLHQVRVVSRAGDSAVVEVSGAHGEKETVTLVREADGWKVELP